MDIPLKLLYIKKYCPGWFADWLELCPIPGQGHVPGLQVWSLALGQRAFGRQPNRCLKSVHPYPPSIFIPLSLPPFPSLFPPCLSLSSSTLSGSQWRKYPQVRINQRKSL